MCGEHRNIIACICVSLGSSPHVRGAQKHCRHRRGVPGIIPACAGSTIRFYPECGGNGDHPRMCGEHSLSINHAGTPVGSSPHVRGAPLRKRGAVGIRRIIPACAGSTCWWRCCCPCWWDHPRMCGEHTAGVALCLRQKRDHPRMCGEHTYTADDVVHSKGSSPHVRGAQCVPKATHHGIGIIPACAGSTTLSSFHTTCIGDHPRMCGEHQTVFLSTSSSPGSSPHVRGALEDAPSRSGGVGIIPACAGSTCICPTNIVRLRDHPRMCGEHGCAVCVNGCHRGSSPHVRGAHFENSIIPRKRKDNWLFFIQFRFENFLAFRYLLALLHPFLGVPTKDPSFASLGRLINCNPSQSTGDQSAPYTLKAICCSFLAE